VTQDAFSLHKGHLNHCRECDIELECQGVAYLRYFVTDGIQPFCLCVQFGQLPTVAIIGASGPGMVVSFITAVNRYNEEKDEDDRMLAAEEDEEEELGDDAQYYVDEDDDSGRGLNR
jgi:hypothetical protein